MYYLTGYDTSGYTMFQGMYLGADGALALLTADCGRRIQSRETSIVEDIRIWHDREDASPGDDLRRCSMTTGAGGSASVSSIMPTALPDSARRWSTWRSTGSARPPTPPTSFDCCGWSRARKSSPTCAGPARSVTASSRVSIERTVPGASVKAVYAAMMQALLEGGGDPTASRWADGSGRRRGLLPLPHRRRGRWPPMTRWCSSPPPRTGTTMRR